MIKIFLKHLFSGWSW